MIETNYTPFPTLITDRLILRELETEDAKDIFAHRSEDRINHYLEDFRHTSLEQTQAFIRNVQNLITNGKSLFWILVEKGADRFIGTVCLWNISEEESKAETGFTIDPEFQGKGYMNEALSKVIGFGFNKMNLNVIEAYTHKNNEPSIRLLLRNKFKRGDSKIEVGSNTIFFSLTNESRNSGGNC